MNFQMHDKLNSHKKLFVYYKILFISDLFMNTELASSEHAIKVHNQERGSA